MIAITGATGQLGRLVIDALLKSQKPAALIALVRDPAKARDLAAKGIDMRAADYNEPDTLLSALTGVERLLLISSSEVGQRRAQHRAVIEATRSAGVKLLAYTSLPQVTERGNKLTTHRRSAWPRNIAIPNRHWPSLACPMSSCEMVGTTRITRPALHRLSNTARSWAVRGMVELPRQPVPTTPRPQRRC